MTGSAWGAAWWLAWGNAWGQWTAEIQVVQQTGGGHDKADNGPGRLRRSADEDADFDQISQAIVRHRARLGDAVARADAAPVTKAPPVQDWALDDDHGPIPLEINPGLLAVHQASLDTARIVMAAARGTLDKLRTEKRLADEREAAYRKQMASAMALAFMEFFDD